MKNNFQCRCSSIGQIMTDARNKNEKLGQTCKTYLEDWSKEQIYGRRKEITSKYFDKGIQVEDESIDFIIRHLNLPMVIKNEQYFENEYITGTPDLIIESEVIDLKNSFDAFTFPLFDHDIPDKNYYWQVQGYMALCDLRKARVIYTLINTPEEIVDKEVNSLLYKGTYSEEKEQKIRSYHNYDSIPVKFRIKEFSVYRDDEAIQKIYDRVVECREYIDTL